MKKLTALLLCMLIVLSSAEALALNLDTEAMYDECTTLYPDFFGKITVKGITDKQLLTFMKDVKAYIEALPETLTEENFDTIMFEAIKYAFSYRRNIKVRDALASAYPSSVTAGMDGVITDEFMPIYITVKRFVFGITTPVVTLSGTAESTLVHYVNMPGEAEIFVGFYDSCGTLICAFKNPVGEMSCPKAEYARAFAFKKGSLSPVCESFMKEFEKDA